MIKTPIEMDYYHIVSNAINNLNEVDIDNIMDNNIYYNFDLDLIETKPSRNCLYIANFIKNNHKYKDLTLKRLFLLEKFVECQSFSYEWLLVSSTYLITDETIDE